MELSGINDALRKNLKVHAVEKAEGFPCRSYADFLEQERAGRLHVLTAFDSQAIPALGTAADRAMYYTLTWSPMIVSAILVVLSFMWSNFWLLVGIPLAFFGLFLSTPPFMKTIGSRVLLGCAAFVIFSGFREDWTQAIVAASYALPNYLSSVARTQCDMIIREAIAQSELVLIWLYLKRSVVITTN